ncbi:MAG: hypothetical protein KDB61_01155, partial [Planctomycetes bacterium]|nr:hypothetical protein [Planctomycetota bacterium]
AQLDKETLFRKAIAQWELCASSRGKEDVASQALYLIAQTYEDELLDAAAAVRNYRRVTFGPYAGSAIQRLDEMLKTSLTIETESAVRSNEAVQVKVQTRNIEGLEVHVHSLDLESYFRKHRTHRNVEDLDLDLIAPELRFEHPVANYSQYTPMEFQLDIPVKGPGVWVVSVIGGEKRATTLVLRSDLDLIVKTSNEDALVFVQNMRQGAPAAGVEVLISVPKENGHEIVRVQTDQDGVARWESEKKLGRNETLHALALSEGHVASTAFNNFGLRTADALAPKSVVYTDRPAYRPGENVNWRAIALKVEGGQWSSAGDTVAQVSLIGPGGQVYRVDRRALGERGSMNSTFPLPDDAASGTWRLCFSGKDLETSYCRFDVESFRMPLAEVVLSTDKELAWRGDRIAVTAQAQTTYGVPLADARLIWHIPGHGQIEVRTDESGRAQYTLETEEYGEAQILTIHASLPAENVHGSARVQLAVSGYSAKIQLDRDLELAGTSFPVTISTLQPNGDPTGQTMTLRVTRNVSLAEGRWKEELLLEREIQTDPKTGKAIVPIEIAMGCQAILSVRGRDQFGQRIEDTTTLQISGPDDATKLRLLTRDASLDLGQKGSVQAMNRADAGLALMTLETDRVVEYRWVQLAKGSNDLEFQSKSQHVPALNVVLNYMAGHKFHQASARFEVRTELNLEILPESETCEPGTPSRITLRATDGSGRPVQGEFSLAAVEDGLFQLYPGRNLDLAQHFAYPSRSFPTVTTQATCEFQYEGATSNIDESILEEGRRVQRQAEWKAAREKILQAPAAPGAQTGGWVAGLEIVEEEAEEMDGMNDMIGLGGGAGGAFGARFGGRKNLRAGGGNRSEEEATGPPDSPTALWVAQVQTNADGIAEVEAVWPKRSTRWRLTAHGIGDGNRFASAQSQVTTQSEFFIELLAPPILVEGDQPQLRVKIHDTSREAGTAQVDLHVLTSGSPVLLHADVPMDGRAIVEHTFPMLAPLDGGQDLQVTAMAVVERGSKRREAGATREIVVQEAGWQQIVSRSGTLTDQTQVNMDLEGTHRFLELHFGVTMEDDLIAQALGQNVFPTTCRWNGGFVQQASDLMAACAVLQAMEGQTGHPAYNTLRDRVQGLVAALSAGQKSGGGWGWVQEDSQEDANTTAHVAIALSRAGALGFPLEANKRTELIRRLQSFVQQASNTDFELRTHLQHALASLDQGDFAALNRLFRSRAQFSIASQAHLALALAAANRAPMAEEIVSDLLSRVQTADKLSKWTPAAGASWVTSEAETTALVALALQAARRPAQESKAACNFLASQRPWPNARTRGYAVWALAQQGLQRLPGQANGFVSVEIMGQAPTR